MSSLRIFIPITKVDSKKRLVYGTISEEIADKSGEILDYETAKPEFQKWSDDQHKASGGKSLGNIRAMHGKIAAGKLTDLQFDDDAKRIEGCAKIVDEDEWEKVIEGVYTGFSIGGGYAKRWPDKANPQLTRYTPTLAEVSIVDNPCVSTATFEYIKADGSVELRKFNHQSQEDIMDPKAIEAAKEALAKGTATDEQKVLLEKHGAEYLTTALGHSDGKVETVKDGKAVKPKTAPVQLHKWIASDGSHHDSKRDAEVHNLGLEKAEELAPALSAMNDLLAKAKKPVDEDEDVESDDEETRKAKKARRDEKAAKAKEKAEKDDAEMAAKAKKDKEEADKAAADTLGKKDYTDDERKEMAGKEAMDDGSYPIKTEKDLKDAIKAYGRAKDKDAAKAHITKRAKALKLTDLLPEEWDGSTKKKDPEKAAAATMQKSMSDIARTACLIDELGWLLQSVTWEEAMEGDSASTAPAEMKAIIEKLCEYLASRVKEETDELIEAHGEDDDDDVMEMAAGLPAGHIAALAKFARIQAEPLAKSDSKSIAAKGESLAKFADALEKAGARHSKADKERLQSVHDGLDEMHKCMSDVMGKCSDMHKAAGEMKNTAIDMGAEGDRVGDEDEDDGRGTQKVAKAFAELNATQNEILAVTKVAASQNETLLKAIPLIEGLQNTVRTLEEEKAQLAKTVEEKNSELAKRVEHLEKQPAAAKGHVRANSNMQDKSGAGQAPTGASSAPAFKPKWGK